MTKSAFDKIAEGLNEALAIVQGKAELSGSPTSPIARKVELPSDKEEATIQAGIAQDPGNPERGGEWFAGARPSFEALPVDVHASLTGRRGPGKRPAKASVSLRLDQDVLEGLRASGPGWQARANAALRKLVG